MFFSKGGFFDNAFVGEVAFSGDAGRSGGRDWAAHIGVEQPLQCVLCLCDVRTVQSVARHREETVGVTGDVDFDVSFFDVVDLRIIGKAVRQ